MPHLFSWFHCLQDLPEQCLPHSPVHVPEHTEQIEQDLLAGLTTGQPEVSQQDQQVGLLEDLLVSIQPQDQQVEEGVWEVDGVRLDEGFGYAGEDEVEPLDVSFFQQVQGIAAGYVHGTAVAGEQLGEVGRWGVRGVVFLELAEDASESVVHHEGEEVR